MPVSSCLCPRHVQGSTFATGPVAGRREIGMAVPLSIAMTLSGDVVGDDLAIREHHDLVDQFEHVVAVGHDDQRRTALLESGDRVGQRQVALGVEVGIRFIEHDQFRLIVQGAGQTDALTLAGRQQVGRDLGFIAVRQLEDHVVHAGRLGRVDHLVRVDHAEARDVLADGAVEQFDILRQVADVFAQGLAIPLRDLGAVEADRAAHGRVDAEHCAHQGRFAGRARADHGDRGARLDDETDALEDRRRSAGRRNHDLLELDVSLRRRQRHRRVKGREGLQQLVQTAIGIRVH